MILKRDAFLEKLDAVIARHSMLDHPFYQAWNEGTLTKETLQEYVKQYYHHVRYFPRYVSAVHAACDDIGARQLLLENLIEEDQGESNHPELWMRFADGLGVDRDSVRDADILEKTRESVQTMIDLTRSEDPCDGLAALYAYESQIPAVSRTKREGLAKHFSLDDDRSVSFFSVHEEADIIHSAVERDLIARMADTEESQARVLASAERAAKALWHFLDGVQEAYVENGSVH